MTDFLTGEMDYILFFYGLAFIMLAAACFIMIKGAKGRLAWGWLGLFGILHGLHEWLDLLTVHPGGEQSFKAVRILLAAVSFVFLAEFGRKGIGGPEGKGPGRWVYVPLTALAAAGGLAGLDGLGASSRYSLGLVGGLWAARTLFLASRRCDSRAGGWLAGGGIFMGLYALATGIVVPHAAFPPASLLNNTMFFQIAGFPIQLARGLFASCIAVSIWVYSQRISAGEADKYDFMPRPVFLPVAVLFIIISAGWALTHFAGDPALLNTTDHVRAYRLFSIFATFVLFGLTVVSFGAIYFTRESAARIATSERRYRSLVDGSPNCVVLFDSEGRCLTINRAGLELTGHRETDIVGKRLDTIWTGEVFNDIHDPVKGVLKGEKYSFETESLHTDGRRIVWRAVLNPVYDLDGRIRHFVGIFMDITERKRAESELRSYHEHLEDMVRERTRELSGVNRRLQVETNERKQAEGSVKLLLEAIESLPVGITITDIEGRIIFTNPADAGLHGYTVEELTNKDARVLAPPELSNPLPFDRLYGMGVMKRESMNLRKNGEFFPVQLTSLAVKDNDGVPIGVITVCEDISERKQVEEELRTHREHLLELVEERTVELRTAVRLLTTEITFRKSAEETLKKSEAKYRRLSQEFHTLLDAIPDILLLISPELKVLWANKGAAASLGKDIHALPGHHCYELWFDRSVPCEDCYALKSLRTGGAESRTVSTPDGRLLDSRAFPIEDENGTVTNVIIVAIDITEKATLQAEALRAGHLASLGELAAGVAHEINNPVNGIINYAQILANKSGKGSRESDISSRIIKEGDRIAGIVRSLLSFARERGEERLPVSVETVLSDTITLTEVQIRKEGIDLNRSVSCDMPRIIANPQQLQQVFLNLISNARYALNQKYPGVHKDKKLDIHGEKLMVDGAAYVRVAFYDQGSGIPQDILEKVINPFFSTKPSGEGTGLGLSISHGIIKDHGGRLMLESREGMFTRVIVDLPAQEEYGK